MSKETYQEYSFAEEFMRDTRNMLHEIYELREEVEELREYKKRYTALLDSSISHGQKMLGQVVTLAMKADLSKLKAEDFPA